MDDDKTFLQITPSGVFAYGSPWSGKHGLDTNVCLPLKGVCFLQRGSENLIRQAIPEDRLGELQHQTLIPEDPVGMQKALSLLNALVQVVPLWEMECTKEPDAALISHRAMSSVL